MSVIDHRRRQYRTERTADENRELICCAARTLFAADGYHETSVDDIAAAIGYTKPFIYYYFESKEHLLLALVEGVGGFAEACRLYAVGGATIRRVRALAPEEKSA